MDRRKFISGSAAATASVASLAITGDAIAAPCTTDLYRPDEKPVANRVQYPKSRRRAPKVARVQYPKTQRRAPKAANRVLYPKSRRHALKPRVQFPKRPRSAPEAIATRANQIQSPKSLRSAPERKAVPIVLRTKRPRSPPHRAECENAMFRGKSVSANYKHTSVSMIRFYDPRYNVFSHQTNRQFVGSKAV